jgi:hypothetical protein
MPQGAKATRMHDAQCGEGGARRLASGKRGRGRSCNGLPPFDRLRCRMYAMKRAQRNSNAIDPTSTTCAHIGITSFANGGKAGIGDCGGGAGGVNGVGGVGGSGGAGTTGVGGINGAGGDDGQAVEESNRAMTLPGEFGRSFLLPAGGHLRAVT